MVENEAFLNNPSEKGWGYKRPRPEGLGSNQPLRRVGALSNPYEGASQLALNNPSEMISANKAPTHDGHGVPAWAFLRPGFKICRKGWLEDTKASEGLVEGGVEK